MRSEISASVSIAVIVLVLSPAGARSQQASAPPAPAQYIPVAPSTGCPIRYSALRYGLGATLRETASGPVSQYAQSLRILLDRDAARTMVRIVGLVHGRDGNPQVLPAQMSVWPKLQARSSDRTEPFEFHGNSDGLDGVQYLYTNAIPLITSIEITQVDFSDGSVWRKSSSASCSVAPSPFVLVNASAQ